MNKILTKFLLCLFLDTSLSAISPSSIKDHKKQQMIQDLEVIKHNFEVGYAPLEWKREYAGWDIDEAFEAAKEEILATPLITTKQFQQIARNFIHSMKDYHVNIGFISTERASLPFSVKGVDGKYFIDWIDPIRLPSSQHGMRIGDEVLQFGDRPISEVVNEIEKNSTKSSNPNTDKALAVLKLTLRQGELGDDVPKGTIFITTRSSQTGNITTNQLRWDHKPEQIRNFFDEIQLSQLFSLLSMKEEEKPKMEFLNMIMATPEHRSYLAQTSQRDGALGSRKSFLPPFGEILWTNLDGETDSKNQKFDEESETDSQEEKENKEFFESWHAYIYIHPDGYPVGYIRIPNYVLSQGQVAAFGKLIEIMEEKTEALVIDQLHNPGGFVNVQYKLLSMLTETPLSTPYHRIKVTQKEALDAYNTLEFIKALETLIEVKENNDKIKGAEDEGKEDVEWFNMSFQNLLFLKDFCDSVLNEWNHGKTLTMPIPIIGVDYINPHAKHRYTKPIVMLIDEMDFSGGDFTPAILQDNQRALLFGARTAGAGGYVSTFEFPNRNGIKFCSYTASLAERVNSQKIENLGVVPDVPYQIQLEDITQNFKGYIQSANKAIGSFFEEV